MEADRKCRICLDGDDPDLGKLIKPCKCNGSIRYVHVVCLNRWRNTSTSRSAFFQCPQCRYKYHFARTYVVGMATSPLLISFFSLNLFILLVFAASFVGSFVLRYFDNSDFTYSSYSYWFYDPISATQNFIAYAIRLMDETAESTLMDSSQGNMDWSRGTPYKMADTQPGIIIRLLRRFILGLGVVGVTGFVQWIWSMSLTSFMHLWGPRGGRRDRRNRGQSALSLIVILLVLAGAARALMQVYRLVERQAKRWLIRAEYNILEVGD